MLVKKTHTIRTARHFENNIVEADTLSCLSSCPHFLTWQSPLGADITPTATFPFMTQELILMYLNYFLCLDVIDLARHITRSTAQKKEEKLEEGFLVG